MLALRSQPGSQAPLILCTLIPLFYSFSKHVFDNVSGNVNIRSAFSSHSSCRNPGHPVNGRHLQLLPLLPLLLAPPQLSARLPLASPALPPSCAARRGSSAAASPVRRHRAACPPRPTPACAGGLPSCPRSPCGQERSQSGCSMQRGGRARHRHLERGRVGRKSQVQGTRERRGTAVIVGLGRVQQSEEAQSISVV